MPTTPTTEIRDTTKNVNLLVDMVLAKRFVSSLREDFLLVDLAVPESLGLRNGLNIRWQFFQNPTAATSALGEGIDPADSEPLLTSKVEATLEQFGDYFELTDFLEDAAISGTLEGFVDAASYQARLTIDTLLQTELATSTNTLEAGTAVTANDIKTAALTLAAADAKFHRGTPGGNFFCAVLASEGGYDLVGEGTPAYYQVKTPVHEENLRTPLRGTPASAAVYNTIVKLSNNVQVNTATSPDDHINFVIADDSYGVTGFSNEAMNPQVIRVPPTPSLASPLGMRGTIGWKVSFATKLFDSARVVKMTSDVTGVGI